MTYQVIVNDKCTRVIRPSRGLRQGDPLSPYLFILVAGVLSRMMEKHVVAGWTDGIKPKHGCPVIHHQFFADNSLLFISGSMEKAKRLRDVIEQYCRASGQKVNFSKSSLFFNSAADENYRREVMVVFGV